MHNDNLPAQGGYAGTKATSITSPFPAACAVLQGRTRIVVVVGDHGDESRYAGGFLSALLRCGLALTQIVVADPGSRPVSGRWWTASRLRVTRPAEARFALALLGARQVQFRQWNLTRNWTTQAEGPIAARLRRSLLPTDLVVVACPAESRDVLWGASRWACESAGAGLVLMSESPCALDGGAPLHCHLADEDGTRKRLAIWAYRSRARPDPYSNHAAEWDACAGSVFTSECGLAWAP
jgi:hypothetical protein